MRRMASAISSILDVIYRLLSIKVSATLQGNQIRFLTLSMGCLISQLHKVHLLFREETAGYDRGGCLDSRVDSRCPVHSCP